VFAPIRLEIRVEPEARTWAFVEELIQSRNAVCEGALRRAGLTERLQELAARSFTAELPRRWARPISMPAGFAQDIEIAGRSAGLRIVPTGVAVTKERLWYGGDLKVR
jgi:hypothetical protein